MEKLPLPGHATTTWFHRVPRDADSCTPTQAWTGEFQPKPTGKERKITSLSRVRLSDPPYRALSSERPTMQMEIEDRGSHYACLS